MMKQEPVFRLSRRDLGKWVAPVGLGALLASFREAFGSSCTLPARNPIEGPYFFGDPEEKTETGSGLILRGVVRDAASCQPISGARIIRWHANTAGIYEEYYRASMTVKSDGAYEMSTLPPGAYANLDPHVHWYVTAPTAVREGLLEPAHAVLATPPSWP